MENVTIKPTITHAMHTTNNPLILSGIKKEIISSDKGLLQKAVKKNRPSSKNYDDSWGYVIQATRYQGFKWNDPHNKALIFFGRKSDEDSQLVVSTFFAEPKYLARVLSFLQGELGTSKTILKNVNTEDVPKFLRNGFRPYKKDEYWDETTRFDDQTHPQLVIKLENLANPRGGPYKNLRTVLNRKPELGIRKYSGDDREKVFDLLALKDNNANENMNKLKGMYYVSHAMYPTADIDKYVIFDTRTGEIVGFTATSDISPKTTAFVASIFKPGVKVASVWGIYNTLLLKYRDKYQFANVGGCETEGTYNFMRRTFQPYKEIAKTHLIYDPTGV